MLLPFMRDDLPEAGCDEAGRGCLAGPVVAAAVILPPDFRSELITDSKALSEKMRFTLRDTIISNAITWAVGICDHHTIDELNILRSSILAMHRALEQLTPEPGHILVDGNRFYPYRSIPHTCVVKGDGKYLSIAAASILAKTFRDEIMEQLHQEYPIYDWNKNKGYPTKSHRDAIRQQGASPYHRLTFDLLGGDSGQLSLPF